MGGCPLAYHAIDRVNQLTTRKWFTQISDASYFGGFVSNEFTIDRSHENDWKSGAGSGLPKRARSNSST